MSRKQYARNVVLQSPLTGCYYFCTKVELLGGGMNRVVGKKVDVTESMKALFGPMLEQKARAIERKAKPATPGKRKR